MRGAKNTLPKSMVAALLTDQDCLLSNVAGIRDVEIVGRMIRALGGEVQRIRLGRNPAARGRYRAARARRGSRVLRA